MAPSRKRPKNRLVTRTLRIKVREMPAVYLHIEREVRKSGLGPVEQIWMTSGSKSGTDFEEILHRLSRRINLHHQIKEVPFR